MLYSGHFTGRGIYPVVWNKWFQRDILLKNLLPIDDRISLGEDMACTYPCLMDAGSVLFIPMRSFIIIGSEGCDDKAGHGSGSGKNMESLPVFGKDFPKGKNAEDCRTAELSEPIWCLWYCWRSLKKYDRIRKLKGKELARGCFAKEAIQYLMDGII